MTRSNGGSGRHFVLIEQVSNFMVQYGKVLLNNIPDHSIIDDVVTMDKDIPEADDTGNIGDE